MALAKSEFPPEPKVVAATSSAGLLSLLITGLSTIAQNKDAPIIIPGVPEALEPFLVAAMVALGTFVSGWWAKHQHRRPAPGQPIVTNNGTVIE